MSLKYIFQKPMPNFPVALVSDFQVPGQDEKIKLLEFIFEDKKSHKTEDGNFLITRDYQDYLKNLYQAYFEACVEILGPFTVADKNSTNCWANCSNVNDSYCIWHSHVKTATINAAYYFNAPDPTAGSIEFAQDNELFTFYPKNYDLLIFPNFLMHKPNAPTTEEYKIAINLEICCEESASDIFKNSRFMSVVKTNDV